MNSYIEHMTEKEIRDEIKCLETKLNAGQLTANAADRLQELRITLAKINNCKNSNY